MRYVLGLPTDKVGQPEEFLTADAIAEIAHTAESSGFDAVAVTDHPFPQDKWLSRGGHQALDPMVALSFAAARTATIKLLTNVYVMPYHNPWLTARAVSSLDVLSGGRVVLGAAVGYLRSEFAALGVDYDSRGAATDEAIRLMKSAWTGESVTVSSPPFEVEGHTMRPAPRQSPHPPIWFGGNSVRAMRRVVEHGQGWMPMPQPAAMSKLTRTPGLETMDDLAEKVSRLRTMAAEAGKARPDVCFVPFGMRMMDDRDSDRFDELRSQIREYADSGVDFLSVPIDGTDRESMIGAIESFGEKVIHGRS